MSCASGSTGKGFFADPVRALSPLPGTSPVRTIEGVLDALLDHRVPGGAIHDLHTIVSLRERLFRASEWINPYDEGEVVIALESIEPLVVCGGWIAQLIERAGARHPLNPTRALEHAGAALGPQHGERITPDPRTVSPAEVLACGPSRLMLIPRCRGLERARNWHDSIRATDWFVHLPLAFRTGSVALLDGSAHDPTPALIDFYEWLVSWLHARPELAPKSLIHEVLT